MNPQDTQQNMGDPKASLGFSNMLREQLFMQENPMPESPEMEQGGMEGANMGQDSTPENGEDLKTEIQDMEERIMGSIDELKTEIKGEDNDEIKSIKKELEGLLTEEENGQKE